MKKMRVTLNVCMRSIFKKEVYKHQNSTKLSTTKSTLKDLVTTYLLTMKITKAQNAARL